MGIEETDKKELNQFINNFGRLNIKEGIPDWVVVKLENLFKKHKIFIAYDGKGIVVSDMEKANKLLKELKEAKDV